MTQSGTQISPAAEARRARIVAILAANPNIRRAVVTDTQSEPGWVAITIALRDVAIGEILISADRDDALALAALLEKYADPSPASH